MPLTFNTRLLSKTLICSTLLFASAQVFCMGQAGPGSDETILVEQEIPGKLCYSSLFKHLSSHLFGVDVDSMLSTNKRTRDAVVRHFADYADRINYRVDLNHDEVTLKMKLTF